jgi:hypothetical protein
LPIQANGRRHRQASHSLFLEKQMIYTLLCTWISIVDLIDYLRYPEYFT